MIKLGLIGGRGYVGEELIGLLQSHPDFELVFAASATLAGKKIDSVVSVAAPTDLTFSPPDHQLIRACDADAWVIAQPNGKAAAFVQTLVNGDCKIIDVSSDYRFDASWVYGLSERNADKIRIAERVANPGCYATGAQLALLPLLDWLDGTPRIFGVSGFSGAGRAASEKNDPVRLADNLIPYSLAGHTHEKEISSQLGREVCFMPHVAQFFRGISLTISLQLSRPVEPGFLQSRFADFYQQDPLVSVEVNTPEIRQVTQTNRCLIGGFTVDQRDPRRVTLVSVLDNLRKGAASQIVQNLNLMFGNSSEKGLSS